MEEFRFNVHFKAEGIPENMVNICGNYLLRAHNRLADLTNGWYEKWNKEYDDIYGLVDGKVSDDTYMPFICKKVSDHVIGTLDKEFAPAMTFTIGDECQLVGHVTMFEGSSIEYYLTKA